MEKCSMLLCGLLIASGILSSQAKSGDKEFAKGAMKGLVVELSPVSSDVLGGNVTLFFHFPRNFSAFSTERTLSVLVYDNSTGKRLHTENVLLRNDPEISVVLPCEVFDHPGLYRFKYRISNSEYAAFISETLTLEWGVIRIDSPTNHTALTRFGSIWIQHNRKCLPKRSRDTVNLFYLKGNKKVLVARKYVRKLSNGKQRIPQGSWIRISFACHVFDIQGIYGFEYKTGYTNLSLATSSALHVHWGRRTLSSHTSKIFPCINSFTVSFENPDCLRPSLTNDHVLLRDKYSETAIARKSVDKSHTAVFFQCSLFKEYVEEYCFDYMTYSSVTRDTVKVASHCLPTHSPGTSRSYDGWSSWSNWGLCSSSCGEGKQHRYRYCLSVSTLKDRESPCAGSALMSRLCTLDPCPVSGSKCSCGCHLTEPEGMITSSPQLFPRMGSFSCTWVISLSERSAVRLSFDALKLNGDTIIIRDGKDSSAKKITIIKENNINLEEPITSSGNNMYIFYKHKGDWTNGTRRGFTASYRPLETDENKQLPEVRRKKLGKQELIFLSVFIFAVIIFGLLLFIVYTKIRRQHINLHTSSSSGSSTSEFTLRSMGTPSPPDDEASSSEPLKGFHSQKIKKDARRSSHRKSTRRTEFLCDADHVPRCTCGEISELESASGSNTASDCSPVRMIRGAERVIVLDEIPCDCQECMRFDRYPVGGTDEFRAPEKKYYGDWMLTEMPARQTDCHTDKRIYGDPCKSFV